MPTLSFIKKATIQQIIDVFILRGYKLLKFQQNNSRDPLKINLLSPGKDSNIISIINIMDSEGILHYQCELDNNEFDRFINSTLVDLNKLHMTTEISTQTD